MTDDAGSPAVVPPANEGAKKRRPGGLAVVLILLAAGIIVLAVLPRKKEPALETDLSAVVPVKTLTVAAVDLPDVVTYAGRIEADAAVIVSAEQAGRAMAIQADKGQTVAPGQALLAIDASSYALRVDRADATFRQATNDLRRCLELQKTGSIPDSDLENMMVRKTMAEVALKEARLDLDKCAVTAPIAGVIQDRFVEKGEYLAPGMRAFSIVDIDRVKVVLDLPERDVYAVRVGDAVPFAVDALPDRKFAGKIRFVAPAANPKSNTFRVEILVENTDHVLKPGVITRISLTRRILKGAIAAPLAALIPEKGLHVAYVVENEHAIRRQVKLQAIVNDQAVVAEGLKAGDKVVIEGQRMVSDGARVCEPAGGANPNPPNETGDSTEK